MLQIEASLSHEWQNQGISSGFPLRVGTVVTHHAALYFRWPIALVVFLQTTSVLFNTD